MSKARAAVAHVGTSPKPQDLVAYGKDGLGGCKVAAAVSRDLSQDHSRLYIQDQHRPDKLVAFVLQKDLILADSNNLWFANLIEIV